MYPHKTPGWLKLLYPGLIWDQYGSGKVIYLTFDDGPVPEATEFVLDQLEEFKAQATFFCVGENIMRNDRFHPNDNRGLLRRLLQNPFSLATLQSLATDAQSHVRPNKDVNPSWGCIFQGIWIPTPTYHQWSSGQYLANRFERPQYPNNDP